MAKDRKKLLHIHSSVLDKQPTAASLEVGEIAVNNAKDKEFLSIKNSYDKVVRFSSDEQIVTLMEKKEVMPYKGYVRGETGPSATSGDTPTPDAYGSYGITENDLLNNKSNIVVKINQVAAGNTVKHDKVNGALDAYAKLVNPTNDDGLTDGAGFYIDMSRYAMQNANPTFSSITNTCKTTLSGTTIIRGLDGACGSLLDINVNSASSVINNSLICGDTLNINETTINITGDTNINGTLCPSSGLCKTLSWTYGNVCNETNGNTNFKENKTVVIPKTIADVTCGDVVNNNPGTTTGCLEINKDVCVNGKVTATDGFFQSSDRNLKENIEQPSFNKLYEANKVAEVKFNYKDDESKRDIYGVIAQELEAHGLDELVHIDEKGNKAVDYTSLMMLKIAFLENEIKLLNYRLEQLEKKN